MAKATNTERFLLAAALIAWCGVCEPALSQGAKGKARATLDLDAAPSPESGAPDPLAPPQVVNPAPLAPGAAAVAPEAKEQQDVDPIVQAARQQLGTLPSPKGAGDREDQAALAAFYGDRARPVWIGTDGLTERAKQAVGEIGKADNWGLKASAFDLPAIAEGNRSTESLADIEIKLSLAVLKYARHARGGRLDPPSVSRRFDQRPRIYDPRSVLMAIASAEAADAYLRGLHPKHEQFGRLQQALAAARAGSAGNAGAVQRLIANMERWRWMPDDLGDFHVWDSVPEQMTRVVDKGKVVLSEKIIVGRPNTPTPVFSADMLFVIFHPSWGVPSGIKTQELWPQLRNTGGGWFSSKPLASSVLKAHGLQVSRGGSPVNPDAIDWSNVDIRGYDFVQPPGPKNVLGIVKFRFPNRHDVYMHDTPERNLFGGAVRAFSHGCMRVQNPVRLAEVILAHDKGLSAADVAGYVRRGGEIRLATPIPVHVTYFTMAVADDGALQEFGDIYGLDSRVASALEGQAVVFRPSAAAGEPPAPKAARTGSRSKSHAPRKASAPPSFNPLSAIFGN